MLVSCLLQTVMAAEVPPHPGSSAIVYTRQAVEDVPLAQTSPIRPARGRALRTAGLSLSIAGPVVLSGGVVFLAGGLLAESPGIFAVGLGGMVIGGGAMLTGPSLLLAGGGMLRRAALDGGTGEPPSATMGWVSGSLFAGSALSVVALAGSGSSVFLFTTPLFYLSGIVTGTLWADASYRAGSGAAVSLLPYHSPARGGEAARSGLVVSGRF